MTALTRDGLTVLRSAVEDAKMMADIAADIAAEAMVGSNEPGFYRVTHHEGERLIFATFDVFLRLKAVFEMVDRLHQGELKMSVQIETDAGIQRR